MIPGRFFSENFELFQASKFTSILSTFGNPWGSIFNPFFHYFGIIFRYLSEPRFFTLRACPPTHLHAPYLYVPCILAPCPASAMRMLTPWVGGDQGTQRRGPRGAGGGARADARCARARADARAARAGALRAPGPLGGQRGPLIRNKSDAKRNR